MKILFAGTPQFASTLLEALLETSHEIMAVYTQPDKPQGRGQKLEITPVKALALEHKIPVLQPTTLKTKEVVEQMQRFAPDVMIVAAYGMLLPESILTLPKHGCINVHASLLPRWRGASPIQHAILAGDKETGITFMQMAKGLDSGDMIMKVACDITDEDTAATLHEKLAIMGANALKQHSEEIVLSLARTPQEENLVTFAPKMHKTQGIIDWQKSAVEIDRMVRAFNPWPIAFCHVDETLLRIWQAKPLSYPHQKEPGTILAHESAGIVVACGKDALLITTAQLPGKKALPLPEIIRGHGHLFTVGKRIA